MPYNGIDNYRHNEPDRLGVLITNLGTPDAPREANVDPLQTLALRVLENPDLFV